MKNKSILQFCVITITIFFSFSANAQNWKISGNTGTNPDSNFLGTTNSKGLSFRTNNIERMRIGANGKIGIGTITPGARFNVMVGNTVTLSTTDSFMLGGLTSANLAFDENEIQSRYNGAGNTLYLNYWGGSMWLGSHNGGSVPALFTGIDGSVAVGSTLLQAGYALTVNPSSTGGDIYFNDPGVGYFALGTKSGNTGEGFRMNISSTTNPYAAIRGHTDGGGYGVLAEATGQYGIGVEGYSSQSYGLWAGTGNSGTYAGYFSGNVYTSGTYNSSDQKLKQNILDFNGAMNIINQLHPKQYIYRQDGDYKLMNLPEGQHYGLIAQDVEKILPNLVKDTKFFPGKAVPAENTDAVKNQATIDFKALNYTELIPIIIKGMQEQQQVIDQQQQTIGRQQQQIDELKQIVQTLAGTTSLSSLSAAGANNTGARLDQNTPNPFSQNTVIRCFVPSTVHQAQLVVYSTAGRQVQSFTLNNKGTNEITISAGTLSSGQYTYTLFADGKIVDSKNMILTK